MVDTDSLPLLSEVTTMPSFRLAFRGYDAREVDRYAYHVEAEIEAAVAIQRDLAADVRSLTDQLGKAHEELSVLRRRPTADDAVSFRHLGPRVEQIIAEAHAEAEATRLAATQEAASVRAETAAHVHAVQSAHARVVAEYEDRQRWLREEEDRLTLRVRSRQDAVARAEVYRDRLRADAEQLLEAAQEQHERLIASALAHSERTQARALAQAREIRERAEREAAALLAEHERAATDQADQPATTNRRSERSQAKLPAGKLPTAGDVEAAAPRR